MKIDDKEAVVLSHAERVPCGNLMQTVQIEVQRNYLSLIHVAGLPELSLQGQFVTPTDPERMSNVRTRETIEVRQTATNSTVDLLSCGFPPRLSSLVSSMSHSHSRLTVMFSVLVTRRGPCACGASINLGSISCSSIGSAGSKNCRWKAGFTTTALWKSLLDGRLVELGRWGILVSSIVHARCISGWIL